MLCAAARRSLCYSDTNYARGPGLTYLSFGKGVNFWGLAFDDGGEKLREIFGVREEFSKRFYPTCC